MTEQGSHDTADYISDEERAAQYFGPSPPPVQLEVGAVSHPGKVRPENEDHYAVIRRHRSRDILMTNLPPGVLEPTEEHAYAIVVADGIGGAAFGKLASMLALRTAWELGGRETAWPLTISASEAQAVTAKLDAYAQLIHRALLDRARVDPRTAGMGTTLTVAYTVGTDAFIAHVGDSRAYLVRHGEIYQITRDHTLAQELVNAGMAPADTAKFGNILTNSLGGPGDKVVTDVHHFRLEDGDGLLVCTDGLSDLVSDEEIRRVLGRGDPAQATCQALVDLALDHGGRDNVTVVLASYGFCSEAGGQ